MVSVVVDVIAFVLAVILEKAVVELDNRCVGVVVELNDRCVVVVVSKSTMVIYEYYLIML